MENNMSYWNDIRTVLTLDAGGTNLVFTAIQANDQVTEDVVLPTDPENLDKCIATIIEGFSTVIAKLKNTPSAISFAFPGPADYPNGIITNPPNLPAFQGGVALGALLEDKFRMPVFINNDGDLYAYGEAIAGYLPYINDLLEKSGSPKRYKNLLGLTLGTGFGAGIVHDGKLFLGDNSTAGDMWLVRNKLNPMINVEEHVSIRGIKREYAKITGAKPENAPSPKEIFDIASGVIPGDKEAAENAFHIMACVAGDAIANAIAMIDGLVVIGGGLSGAHSLFLPYIIDEMNGSYVAPGGKTFPRLSSRAYNLEVKNELESFLKGSVREINVYGTDKKVTYDSHMRTGVGISKIGASKAISIGAYAFALSKLDS